MLKGGESGPAINEKDPSKSLLLQAVRHEGELKMPPKMKLAAGGGRARRVGSPRGPVAGDDRGDVPDWRKHWAFRPVTNPVPPADPNDHWSRTTIDRFILAKLREKGLAPSAEADKRTLIRRRRST